MQPRTLIALKPVILQRIVLRDVMSCAVRNSVHEAGMMPDQRTRVLVFRREDGREGEKREHERIAKKALDVREARCHVVSGGIEIGKALPQEVDSMLNAGDTPYHTK